MNKQSLFPATFSRRAVLAATAAVSAIGLLGAAPAHAQAWPNKMIKLVVPFPAGGPTDTASRIVGQRLSERLGQPVVVENRAGGGGTVGAAETARAHAAGAMVVWDLSHAVGAIDIDLRACGVQLAIGCSYKFLNGGPGAPAWTYVARELHDAIRQPIWGWFATEDQFAMGPTFRPRADIARMLLGTPSILALAAAEVGIALSAEAGMPAIHAKGGALTGFAIDLCDQYGLATPTPRDPARRGNHVAVEHANAKAFVKDMTARDILFDFREPNIIRAGCSPLTTRFVDVYDGMAAIADLAARA